MITFVIPAYGESVYLVELINSLLNQTYKCKIILTTSTPNIFLENICSKYKIEYIINPIRNTLAEDWNFALGCVRTKYAVLTHQDDLYHKDFAVKMLNESEKHIDNLISFSFYDEILNGVVFKNSSLTAIKKIILTLSFTGRNALKSSFGKKNILRLGSSIPCPAVMYNLQNLQGFEFNNTYNINLDWDAWVRMSEMKGNFVHIPEALMSHRLHHESATFTGIRDNRRQLEDQQIFSRLFPKPFDRIIALLYSLSYKRNENVN